MQVRYSCKWATFDANCCQLSSVASLSHRASTLFVRSTFALIQRVAQVCQRQLILVMRWYHVNVLIVVWCIYNDALLAGINNFWSRSNCRVKLCSQSSAFEHLRTTLSSVCQYSCFISSFSHHKQTCSIDVENFYCNRIVDAWNSLFNTVFSAFCYFIYLFLHHQLIIIF